MMFARFLDGKFKDEYLLRGDFLNALTLFESHDQNKYFYDQKITSTQWCHPVLYHILGLHQKGAIMNQWFNELEDGEVHLEGCGVYSKAEISYHFRKYLLLLKNGFFARLEPHQLLENRLTAEKVKSTLANTRQVTFEIVDYCNLDCTYCTYGKFYNNFDHRGQDKMSSDTAKTFLDYMLDLLNSPLNESHDQPFAIGFYGGEPLLNMPFIREVVTYARQLEPQHNRLVFNMTTNALLLEKYMDFLAQYDFDLLISLDGNEYNNSYRVFHDGSPAFQHIVKNIDALKTKHPDYFKSRVNFNSVFHNRNRVTEIYRFFKDRYDKIPGISELNPGGVSAEMRKKFWGTYANVAADLSKVEDYALVEKDMFHQLPDTRGISTFLDRCSGFSYNDYNELLMAAVHNSNSNDSKKLMPDLLPTGTCVPFSRKVFITVKGKILPCEHIGHQFGLGSVTGGNVDLDFQKIANTHNGYLDKVKNQCRTCANWDSCFQCLYYVDIEEPNPKCRGKCNKNRLSKELSSYISYLEKNPLKYTKIMKEVRIE